MEERTVFQPSANGSVRPGTRLNNVYQIEKLINQGGMGEVYRGFNIQTRDIVAIKVIRPEFMNNPEVFELFRREASILHNLTHQAIVRYFVFSVDPDIQRAYLAMEFVDGPSLTKRLGSGPLPLAEVRILQRRIGRALEAAHRLGVIHRDVSPDNIILPDGDVRKAKIIDFGIARSLSLGERTIIGSGFAGKYNYVSPEQLGMGGGEVTFKSDIYSFGLVLAEAARGRPLDMSGSQADIIEKRRSVPDVSDVDRALRPLIHAMLEPLPEKRPPSMAAVAEWGESHRVAAARRASLREDEAPARESSSGRLPAILGGVIAAVSLAGVGYVFRDDLGQRVRSSEPVAATQPMPVAGPPPLAGGSKPAAGMAALPPLAPPAASGPSSAPQPPASAPEKPSHVAAPAPPEAGPPADHVPTTDELADAAPPHAPQTLVELPQARAATPYRAELPAFSDPGGQGLRLAAEALPQGLAFEDLGDGKGVIQGAPTEAGSATMHIVATNHAGRTAQMTATLMIADRPNPSPPPAVKRVPAEQKTSPASAPAAPAPEARLQAHPSPADRERHFVESYTGGDCFLVEPLPGGAHVYLGVGDDLALFKRFEEAFKSELGAEPQLSLRPITAPECLVIELLRPGAGGPSGAPRIELADYRIGRGKPLSGKILNLGARQAYLVLIDNDGAAYRLDAKAHSGSDSATFSVSLHPDAGSTGPLQVVLAIVSSKPIPALDSFRSGPLTALAPALLEEARSGSASIGAEFFTFVK